MILSLWTAAKGQYIHFLPDVMRLLKVGGILISDNVLQDGDIIESHYAVERRNRTIYKRMREYLYELKHDEHLMTSIEVLFGFYRVSLLTLATERCGYVLYFVQLRIAKVNLVTGTQDSSTWMSITHSRKPRTLCWML